MRKERTLKYLILTFVMAASFFMFSKASVQAAEMIKIQGNLYFELEEDVSGDPTKGYNISGAVCSVFGTCDDIFAIEELVIPAIHTDGNPIIGISAGHYSSTYGTLDFLKDISIEKISVAKTADNEYNLIEIAECAFCNLNVNEIDIPSSVELIGDYAFANSTVKVINISRYKPVEAIKYTQASNNSFANSPMLRVISFLTKEHYDRYTVAWNGFDVADKYTYPLLYKFVDSVNSTEETKTYYFGKPFETLPEVNLISGLNFLGWYYKNNDQRVLTTSIPSTIYTDVVSKWEISMPTISINTYVNGELEADSQITYAGKNTELEIRVDVLDSGVNYEVEYEWESVIKGAIDKVGNGTNSYGISYVNQSGLYNCYVTVSYMGYTQTETISINAEILKRSLNIQVGDKTAYYGEYALVDEYQVVNDTTFAVDEKIKGLIFKQYTKSNSDIEVGKYDSTLEIDVTTIGYEDDDVNYIDNYDIVYIKGDLEVLPRKKVLGYLIDTKDFIYGDNGGLVAYIEDVVYKTDSNPAGITKNLIVTYQKEAEGMNDVGEYRITGVKVDDDNYEVKLDSSEYTINIIPKQVTPQWTIDENLVYNGQEKTLSAEYLDIDNNLVTLDFKIEMNDEETKLVNAGTYKVTIDKQAVNLNYTLEYYTREIVIDKAKSAFIDSPEKQTKVYNGFNQTVDVKLNHNEAEVVQTCVKGCKDAHDSLAKTYSIEVEVEESPNYYGINKMFYLHINPYELYVRPDLFKVTYGRAIANEDLSKTYSGLNGDEVLVRFTKSGISDHLNAGFYDLNRAIAINTGNYDVKLEENSGIGMLQIVPAPIEIEFYFYENLVYDGKEKKIGVKVVGASEDVGLQTSYGENVVVKNAGNYTLSVNITNSNFYIDGAEKLDFSIAKANYDVSKLKLLDKEVSFNFKSHSIRLEGELPPGLSVVYEIDGKKGNGTFLPFKHEIKVSFVGDFDNYNYIEPLIVVLNISITKLLVWIVSIVGTLAVLICLFIYLIKTNKIRFTKRIKKSVFRQIARKNRELSDIMNLIVYARNNKKEDEEEIIEIEEKVKFVKNPVAVNPDDMVALSFVDKLFRSEIETKQYYSEVKNELLSYDGVVSKIKRDYETFYLNNVPIAKFNVENGQLEVYFALDPIMYDEVQYKHQDVSKNKDFVTVPLKLIVRSIESLRHAKMFVRIIRRRENIKFSSNFVRTDYVKVYTVKEGSFSTFKKVFVKKSKEEN